MKNIVFIILILCLSFLVSPIISPIFAAGNLTINGTSLAPAYVNTNQSYEMLRLDLNITPGTGDNTVNITMINVTLAGSATTGNITIVEIKNLTGSVLGTNTTWNTTTNKTTIRFSSGLFVNASTNYTIIVAFNISANAASLKTVAANLNVTTDINTTNSADNITIAGTSTSTASQIQDIRASAVISPKYVDTGVINQSFVYNLTIIGDDEINNTVIFVPAEYSIVNVTAIHWVSTSPTVYPTTLGLISSINISDYKINITFASSAYAAYNTPTKIMINFTLNTSSSTVNTTKFNSTLTGANLTNINTTLASMNDTNVETKQMFTVQSISIIKSAAIINDTDYWEFNFTINFTKNMTTTGLLQFRMSNWNNTAGQLLNLTNQTALTNTTRYYTSLRLSDSSSNTFNVTNEYNFTRGVTFNLNTYSTNIYYIVLKMVIPSGTPVSSAWWTTYYALFRSSP